MIYSIVKSTFCSRSSGNRPSQCSVNNGREVFFSAGLNVSGPQRYAYGEAVVFDTVFSNVGSGYNKTSGFFTCPLSGFYRFSINLRNNRRNDASFFHLKKNTEIIADFIVLFRKDIHASKSIILKLTTGDVIKLQSFNALADSSLSGERVQNTFSGQLISTSGKR